MSRRQQRVEELLRREIAQMLLRGELRDPRLSPATAVGITGVQVSADLSVAKVFVDVLTDALRREDVLKALQRGGGLIRRKLGERIDMRRIPELRFEPDSSITRGARIEEILTELREQGDLQTGTEAESASGSSDDS